MNAAPHQQTNTPPVVSPKNFALTGVVRDGAMRYLGAIYETINTVIATS